jgi:hypothetical protein
MLVAGGSGAQNAGLEKAGAIVLPGFDELLALLRTRDTRKSA